ncbi:MAG: LysE family translocator [Chloroflexota bacterium]
MEILIGLLIGSAYVAAPGPIIVETLRQGMCGGLRASLAVQGGSVLGRLLYGGIAVLGVDGLLQREAWQPILSFGGMVLLIYLGLSTIRDAGALAPPAGALTSVRPSTQGALATGALLSLANPVNIVFWVSIGGATLQQPGPQVLTFLCAFAAGCVAASLLAAFLAAFWQPRLSGGAARVVSYASGLVLIGYGLHTAAVAANLVR